MTRGNIISELSDRTVIWRYMDFTKFIDMLDTKSLYFCNAMLFEDPLDSSLWNIYSKTAKKSKGVEKQLREFFSNYGKSMTYANCWHINKVESAALWRLYLKSNEGVAIKSTVGRFKKALVKSPHKVNISKVVYDKKYTGTPAKDGKGKSYAPLDVAKLKLPSFSHEKELRAIIIKPTQSVVSEGINVTIDPNILIQKVYVAPRSPEWFTRLIKSTSKKFGYNLKMEESELYKEPCD